MDEPLRLVAESVGEEALSVAEPLSYSAAIAAFERHLRVSIPWGRNGR